MQKVGPSEIVGAPVLRQVQQRHPWFPLLSSVSIFTYNIRGGGIVVEGSVLLVANQGIQMSTKS